MLLDDELPSQILRRVIAPSLLDEEISGSLDDANQHLDAWRTSGIRVTSPFSEEYPAQLRGVHDYPPLLFSRGSFLRSDDSSVAIVGTRAPSEGALRFIRHLVPLIAERNITVVSGLARGVDSAAIVASMERGNRTVGIIGTGLNRYYPKENHDLQDSLADSHLLLSQFWPDAPPTKQSFPMRNHVMSAYSGLTLIVEAGENSGTRIQARAATKHARPLIISRAVYTQTQWAKDLVAQRFDVTVVADPAEAIAAIDNIRVRRSRPSAWIEGSLTLANMSA